MDESTISYHRGRYSLLVALTALPAIAWRCHTYSEAIEGPVDIVPESRLFPPNKRMGSPRDSRRSEWIFVLPSARIAGFNVKKNYASTEGK